MASVTLFPSRLHGAALVPPSKSEAHRALLLAALGDRPCRLHGFPPMPAPLCDDTLAMINGITALGASVRREGTQLLVSPIPPSRPAMPMVTCHVYACAAALRMLIPAFLVQGQAVRFSMEEGLYLRPLDAFEPLIRQLDAHMQRIPPNEQGIAYVEVSGKLPAGQYDICGSSSSQFASGMLLALSRATPSRLRVTLPIVSRPYLDMTLGIMQRFGLSVTEETEGTFALSPKQNVSPADIDIAGDWSQAAVFLCMNALGSQIRIANLPQSSLQGDARITELLDSMGQTGALHACHMDCTDIPDLVPMLALVCSQANGTSTLSGVHRLRFKESDRLCATREVLANLGVQTALSTDGDVLTVFGPAMLRGGFRAHARQDHRLVMLLAAAALIVDGPITIDGVECIRKSWPAFWATYRELGGVIK